MTRSFPALLAAALLASVAPQSPALADPALAVENAWARPVIGARPTAAYLEIANGGTAGDRLVAATSPAFGTIEFHETTEQDGVMRMARVDGIPVPPGGSAVLEPGGLHIMLFEPAEALAEGDSFPLTLEFESAAMIEVSVSVEQRGASGGMDHGGHSHGEDHSHGSSAEQSHDHGEMHGDMEQPPE